jgi:hypothetical protein
MPAAARMEGFTHNFLPCSAPFGKAILDKGDNLFPFGSVIFNARWHIETILFQDVLQNEGSKADL